MHGRRHPPHVHENHPRTVLPHDLGHGGIIAKRTDIIHNRGAEIKTTAGDLGFRGINRDRYRYSLCQLRDDRSHTAELFFKGDRLRSGPRRLSADVHNVRAVMDHLEGVVHRVINILESPPVRKGIGRKIENCHEQHPLPYRKRMFLGEPSLGLWLTHVVLSPLGHGLKQKGDIEEEWQPRGRRLGARSGGNHLGDV